MSDQGCLMNTPICATPNAARYDLTINNLVQITELVNSPSTYYIT